MKSMSSKKAFTAMGRNQSPRKDVHKGDRLTERASGSHAKERVRPTSGFSAAKLDAKRQ